MTDLQEKLEEIEIRSTKEINEISSLSDLEKYRIEFSGRKSELVDVLRSIKDLSSEDKISVGKKANEIKVCILEQIDRKKADLQKVEIENEIKTEWIDVTASTGKIKVGVKHPISQMMELTLNIFSKMGFEVVYPNEIDSEFNNFDAVNIPANHPARDMWDTFWTEEGNVAITHTSSMQNRVLKSHTPPVRVVVPGKCFRNEATDARHEHTFYQVEGIYVDRGINMSHMLGTLKAFFSEFFGQEINVMFTPDFFPFVEPGGMMSIDCSNLGEGFKKVSKGTGWLEVLGCGMIHPYVLELAGIDSNVYSGFAWGFGLERLIMLKYGIDDIRLFNSGDLRFIHQFK